MSATNVSQFAQPKKHLERSRQLLLRILTVRDLLNKSLFYLSSKENHALRRISLLWCFEEKTAKEAPSSHFCRGCRFNASEYMKVHIFELRRMKWKRDWSSQLYTQLKGAQSRLNGLKSLAKLFNFVVFQSVSIFSILNHPCSVMLCYNLFGVFLSL